MLSGEELEFFTASPARRRENFIKSKFPEIYEKLKTDEYNDFITFSDKITKYLFGGGYCKICNARTKKDTGCPGFREYCSPKCAGIAKQGQVAHNKADIDEDIVKDMYLNQKKSPKDIGDYFNVSNVTINKIIEKLGIKRTHSEQQKIHSLKGNVPWNSGKFDRTKAYDLKFLQKENETKSIGAIAKEIGCSASLIFQLFKREGIEVNNLTMTKPEIAIYNLLDELKIEYDTRYRDIKELDAYIPSKNIGIEVNGLYWHSEKFRDHKYHKEKSEHFAERDIKVLHFWENEILESFDIVKNIIKVNLGLIENKIYARKCIIKEVETKEAKDFCNENHLSGFVGSNIKRGLYYDNKLVALAMFTKPRYYKNADYELTRFCTIKEHIIVGGFSKLINTMSQYSIVSYADKRYSNGNVYENNGFTHLYDTNPNHFWCNFASGEIFNRVQIKGNYKELQKQNIYRVFDCGSKLYIKRPKFQQ